MAMPNKVTKKECMKAIDYLYTNDLELLQHTYEWDVGGAFMVDQTDLIWSYWPKDKFNGKSCHCYTENHEKLLLVNPGRADPIPSATAGTEKHNICHAKCTEKP